MMKGKNKNKNMVVNDDNSRVLWNFFVFVALTKEWYRYTKKLEEERRKKKQNN